LCNLKSILTILILLSKAKVYFTKNLAAKIGNYLIPETHRKLVSLLRKFKTKETKLHNRYLIKSFNFKI
jgi:hypothetical protein